MRIKVQPEELKDKTLPYPYFIEKDGLVGRQDFWKGKPYRLLGFSKKPVAGDIELIFAEFWKSPKKATGMYAVFTSKRGQWTTSTIIIDRIEKIKDKKI